MDEGVNPTGQPVEGLDGLDEQLGRACPGVAATQPGDVEVGFCREGLLFALVVDLDERHCFGPGFEPLQ